MRGTPGRGLVLGGFSLGLLAWTPGCGDSGDTGASQSTTSITSATDTAPTTAGPGTLPTTSATTEGGGTQGMTGTDSNATQSTGGTTVDPTQGTVGETGPAMTTTGAISVSTGDTGDTSLSGSSTDGPKEDMGGGCPPDNQATTFDYIWIANTSQATVSKIETLSAANSGVYGRIQAVG